MKIRIQDQIMDFDPALPEEKETAIADGFAKEGDDLLCGGEEGGPWYYWVRGAATVTALWPGGGVVEHIADFAIVA